MLEGWEREDEVREVSWVEVGVELAKSGRALQASPGYIIQPLRKLEVTCIGLS